MVYHHAAEQWPIADLQAFLRLACELARHHPQNPCDYLQSEHAKEGRQRIEAEGQGPCAEG